MAADDLILNREDVRHFAVVALGPEMVSVGGLDQLRGDADAVTGAAHAAFQHVATSSASAILRISCSLP